MDNVIEYSKDNILQKENEEVIEKDVDDDSDSDDKEEEQDVLFPVWKKNSNGCGYSIDVETPSLTKLISAVGTRLQNGKPMVKILEIGVGDSHVLAHKFLNDIRVQVTFVDPGSNFDAFPQSN